MASELFCKAAAPRPARGRRGGIAMGRILIALAAVGLVLGGVSGCSKKPSARSYQSTGAQLPGETGEMFRVRGTCQYVFVPKPKGGVAVLRPAEPCPGVLV